jgi:hypothetical protein
MKTLDQATTKSLLSKLSAVRMTLSDDEQALLDQMVQNPLTEVAAHILRYAPEEAGKRGPDEVAAHARSMDAAEVVAHSSKFGPEGAVRHDADEVVAHAARTFTPDGAVKMGADEVVAHSSKFAPEAAVRRDPDEVVAHLILRKPHEAVKMGAEEVVAHIYLPFGVDEIFAQGAEEVVAHLKFMKPEEVVVRAADEVSAHIMPSPLLTSLFMKSRWAKLSYDPFLEAYRIND